MSTHPLHHPLGLAALGLLSSLATSCFGPLEPQLVAPVGPFELNEQGISALEESSERFETTREVQGVQLLFTLPDVAAPLEIELRPRNLLAPDYKAWNIVEGGERVAEPNPIPISLFVGVWDGQRETPEGEADTARLSLIRVSARESRLEGIVIRDGVLYGVSRTVGRVDGEVRGRTEALTRRQMREITARCGLSPDTEASTRPDRNGSDRNSEIGSSSQALLSELPLGTVRTTHLSLVGDVQFNSIFSNSAQAHAELIANLHWAEAFLEPQIETVFQVRSSLIYKIEVSRLHESFPDFLLTGLRRETEAYFPDVNIHSHIHLLTPQELDEDAIGISFIGGVCDERRRYGLSQYVRTSPARMSVLIAHEIGHNFDMSHDFCPEGDDEWIMCPNINNSASFSETSLRSASNWVRIVESEYETASCFTPEDWTLYGR